MLPNFLLAEHVVRQNGSGPPTELGDSAGQVLCVTLGINRILEQESIDLSIWGSADGENFGDKPIASFPQKFYCGVYTLTLDLTDKPEFDLWRWVDFWYPAAHVVSFKRSVYERALRYLAPLAQQLCRMPLPQPSPEAALQVELTI